MANQTLIAQAEKMYQSQADTTDYAKLLLDPAVTAMKENIASQKALLEDIMSKMERHRQHEILKDSMPLMERMIFKNIGYVYARKNLNLRKTWKYSQIDKIYNDQTAYAISQVSQLSVLKNKPGLSDSEKKEITTELKKHQKDIATWTNWMTAAYKWVETSMK